MENKDKYNREKCPVCGRPLPFSIVKNTGDAVISIYCRKCKSVSEVSLNKK